MNQSLFVEAKNFKISLALFSLKLCTDSFNFE